MKRELNYLSIGMRHVFFTLEIEVTADENVFRLRKIIAAHLKTSYLKYALVEQTYHK